MKNARRLLPLLFALILLSSAACSIIPRGTTEAYTQLCQGYVGQNVKALTDQWGEPYRTLKTPKGNTVYVYREIIDPFAVDVTDYTALVDYPPFIRRPQISGDVTGGFYLGENCVTYFEANPNGTIIKVLWKGDCRAKENP
jgi:hypothetical protein